jgi:NAD-reducing hydrogenase small subunit
MTLGSRLRLATVWLSGCSGCHMSLLDLDEWLFVLADLAEIVYSPVASDCKIYPSQVDVCLVEGAVANRDNLELALQLRARSTVVIALGDCAALGNVTALRNLCGPGVQQSAGEALDCAYRHLSDGEGRVPTAPILLPRVLPLHRVIAVDGVIAGCPPTAAAIRAALEALLQR